MNKEKNHVGRPTNEEVKERHNKKIFKILIIIIVLVSMFTFVYLKTDFIKIQGSTSNSDLKEIPYYIAYEAKVNKLFSAGGVRKKGFKISVSGDGLVKGYKSSKITKKDDYYLNVKYDKPGKKTVTFSKKGYKTVKKNFYVLPAKLTLNCPTTVYVNKQFTCSTNVYGAVISVPEEGLAYGYNTSFRTTTKDLTKQTKYITPGKRAIRVRRVGVSGLGYGSGPLYKPVTKIVNVIKK